MYEPYECHWAICPANLPRSRERTANIRDHSRCRQLFAPRSVQLAAAPGRFKIQRDVARSGRRFGRVMFVNTLLLVIGCANVWAVFYPRSGMPTDTACYNTIELDIGALKAGALCIGPPEDFDQVRCSAVLLPGCWPVRASELPPLGRPSSWQAVGRPLDIPSTWREGTLAKNLVSGGHYVFQTSIGGQHGLPREIVKRYRRAFRRRKISRRERR